jgi:hypothetical protein
MRFAGTDRKGGQIWLLGEMRRSGVDWRVVWRLATCSESVAEETVFAARVSLDTQAAR